MNFDVFYYINGTSAFYCGKNLFRINILSQCSRKFYKGGPLDEKNLLSVVETPRLDRS